MKRAHLSLPAALLAVSFALPPSSGHAFWKKLFGKDDLERAPNSAEMQSQEAAAAGLIADARRAESDGRSGKAMSLYESVVENYPLTAAAAVSQFRIAELLEADGKISKAFDAYQKFVDSYRRSAEFSAAIERQFAIASAAKDGAKESFLGIPRRIDSSRVVEMYEGVISNAPRSEFAPKSQFAIGEVHADLGEVAEAVTAFQKVVDNYPDTEHASRAQFAIGKINFAQVEDGTNDAGSVRAAREAMEDYLLLNAAGNETSEVQETLTAIDTIEAARRFKVAKFYQKQGNLKAAAIYYSDVAQVPSSPHFTEAREQLADIAAAEPEALRKAPDVTLAQNELVIPAEEDVKSRSDYLGPPAPVIASRRPQMRTSSPAPLFPAEEPDLPEAAPDLPDGEEIDMVAPLDSGDLLLPPPPPEPDAETESGEDTPAAEADDAEDDEADADELPLPEPPPPPPAPEEEESN